MQQIPIRAADTRRFDALVGAEQAGDLRRELEAVRKALAGRTVWHVNSTASGGGVAEMLGVLLGYLRGADLDVRWAVTEGEPDFFTLTKRLHNRLHNEPGDGGPLDAEQRRIYERVSAANAEHFAAVVRPGDLVILHDPQTAGLVRPLAEAGARVAWRCHIGCDRPGGVAEEAWAFLRPHVEGSDSFVFSRRAHVHPWMPEERVAIVPPSIDPFSPKNCDMEPEAVRAMAGHLGLLRGDGAPAQFLRSDGTTDQVRRRAEVVRAGEVPPAQAPLVTQISRWDRLKDMRGVMGSFASGIDHDAHLALVGPSVSGVSDDPEGAEVLAECAREWDRLPATARRRIHLVCLPMDDRDENAAMVNAIQRHSRVVTQKSLAEGFGLTVTEAMWKARPVVASAVGGIQDQIVPGEHGLLVEDPADGEAFAGAVDGLLDDPPEAARLGGNARGRVRQQFLGNRHLLDHARLYTHLAEGA